MSNLTRRWAMMQRWSQWTPWLTPATEAAIRTAFGLNLDSIRIIKAACDYLDGLDANYAQNLVDCINEDPMLVVCLPISVGFTLPVRYVKTTSTGQYFSTGVYKETSKSLREESVVKYDKINKERYQGAGTSAGEFWGVTANNNYYSYTTISQSDISKRTIVTANYTGRNNQLFFFSGAGADREGAGCYRSESKIYVDDVLVRDYVPFKRNGNMELLNLLDLTLCSRTGTLAEHFEYPNGTAWLPNT